MQRLEETELRKADRTVGVNCYIFSNISSGKRQARPNFFRIHLACTRCNRGDNEALLIGSVLKPVSRRTISKRIMVVMHRINVDLFWPYSTGAAATSKASVYSVPLDQFLSTSGWSSGSKFGRFTTNL